MESDSLQIGEALKNHSHLLRAIATPSASAPVGRDMMSGGLIWTDEIQGLPAQVVWELRPLFAFRSSLILGRPEEKWRGYWQKCLSMFPEWIGFRPERSLPTPEFLSMLQKKPNKAPEPTLLPVTPRAEPRVAPGSSVAHL